MARDQDAARNMQRFARGRASRREATARQLVVASTSLEEEARAIFTECDHDGNGHLTFKEMCAAVRALSARDVPVVLDMASFEEKFEAADTNGDHRVCFDEFVTWYNYFLEWARHLDAQHKKAEAEVPPPKRLSKPPRGAHSRNTLQRQDTVQLSTEERDLVWEMRQYDGMAVVPKAPSEGAEASRARVATLLDADEMAKHGIAFIAGETAALRASFIKGMHRIGLCDALGKGKRGADALTMRVDRREFGAFACVALGKPDAGSITRLFEAALASARPEPLEFRTLCAALVPLLKGTRDERLGFGFRFYDANMTGSFTLEEIWEALRTTEPSSALETDLLQLAVERTPGQKVWLFDDYLKHVDAHGEHPVLVGCRAAFEAVVEEHEK